MFTIRGDSVGDSSFVPQDDSSKIAVTQNRNTFETVCPEYSAPPVPCGFNGAPEDTVCLPQTDGRKIEKTNNSNVLIIL
jgi:hypothetical protein